ncbi:DUF2971 domain-containing protein [Ensifer sp. 1H6]|uniref:DUF2971 domain-containing protein n=1 Tax=Ensifer sp. 1H6 TaxID=1911585 RepID=UPI0009CB8143|nr:DUF2971 domain-containing protein [Ensifer sp. 1H6]OMQ31300.1 hypothetical protein BKP54_33755 [Ensifer sp. 1H6]
MPNFESGFGGFIDSSTKRWSRHLEQLAANGLGDFYRETLLEEYGGRTLTHYTSLEGFRSIITNSELWASNIRFLNDRREMDYGIDEAIKFLEANDGNDDKETAELFAAVKERLTNNIPEIYACCFCEHNDSLGQWRGYTGGGQGVAIEFNARALNDHFETEFQRTSLYKVIYGEDHTRFSLKKAIRRIFGRVDIDNDISEVVGPETTIEGRLLKLLLRLAPQFKHDAFKDELEWRLIVNRPSDVSKIAFRTRDNVLVPYVKLGDKDKPLPIGRVIVGPGKDMHLTEQSVRMFLGTQSHYLGVKVEKSTVPFRT